MAALVHAALTILVGLYAESLAFAAGTPQKMSELVRKLDTESKIQSRMIQFSMDYSTKQHNAPKNDYRLQYRLSCVVSYITFTVNFVSCTYKRTICRGSPKYLQSRRQVTKFTRLNVRRPGVFNSTCPSAIAEKAKPRLGFR